MCGIAGLVSWRRQPDHDLLRKMSRSIAHRGPDAEGEFCDGPVAFAHRRLAILDLDARANQPFLDASGRYVLVFNGEIYNYAEIRSRLQEAGVRLRTTSDTEALLEALIAQGTDALDDIEGMFAFAFWDRRSKRLLLARDRMGEKPLYYMTNDDGVAFASELPALRLLPEASEYPHADALLHYLRFGYLPSAQSVLKSVKKLPPAHYLWVDASGPQQPCRYWDIRPCFAQKSPASRIEDAAEELGGLLDGAVRRQRIADVEAGVFLSGGLDSSSIAASLSACSQAPPKAFTIGFDVDGFDETDEASRVARSLNIDHHIERVGRPTASQLIAECADQGEPLADTSFFPTHRLSLFARQMVKVALGGDGADEMFAGYSTYAADWLAQFAPRSSSFWNASAALLAMAPHGRGKVPLDFKLRQFASAVGEGWPAAHPLWRQFADLNAAKELLAPDMRACLGEELFDPAAFASEIADAHYADQAMYIDMQSWLSEDILVKVDRASMAHGLEVRSPFLDRSVVEFAARLKPSLRWSMGVGKRVLRRSQAKRLPPRALRRAKKGFNAPVADWFDADNPEIAALFSKPGPNDPFDNARVLQYWREHQSGARDRHLILLSIFCYRVWAAGH